ncbi:uncharacterized protein MYCFIDRAFT_170471 [Pseudocercospora fijiensis CIRAD86]|uniref:BZIP domain-containing protein n=1 Tax=Pseudocercospora fijiensis (strain CIRAD86) TaxID=383855 RepID=N1QC35_PSEFD|nr:uncharacterized protein MYCFIDRAFT_170471 [Pseudocercospora fijiensis CIRAD86]EME88902.1 hypothetical protein MYCFIDRAFT_170471 [Pseudocercospora fijiensis CIRAD86]
MSDRPRDQRPPDTSIASANDAQQRAQQYPPASLSDHYGPRTVTTTPSTTSPALHRPPTGNGRTMELPPLPQAPSASGGSFPPASTASRSVGVASILNPTDGDDSFSSRRRKASQLESPHASLPILPPLGTQHQVTQSARATPTPSSMQPVTSYSGERAPRRILTPRSPSLHRAASLNQLSNPSPYPTFSAQQAPFLLSPRSRSYAIEPGTAGAPPLPTPPAAMRPSYGFPTPAQSAHLPPMSQRASGSSINRPGRPTSESTSPRSSYSSYSQAGLTSPAATYASASMPTLSSAYPEGAEHLSSGATSAPTSIGPDRQRAVGVPISASGGQNVYQMMTLETTSGTVQLPVDVQAASRVADEKRRRNAGASARFRQRRKEKEKEASSTISRLELQVKELSEDMDFYKRERDYMAGVVLQVPGGDRHFPRPQSPRHRRSSGYMGSNRNADYMTMQDQGGRSPDEGRNVRRRTSTLSLPPPPQASNHPLPPPGTAYQSGYAPQGYGHPLQPLPQPAAVHQASGPMPSPSIRGPLPTPTSAQAPPGAHQLMQASPQTGPWNPYADRRGPGHPKDSPTILDISDYLEYTSPRHFTLGRISDILFATLYFLIPLCEAYCENLWTCGALRYPWHECFFFCFREFAWAIESRDLTITVMYHNVNYNINHAVSRERVGDSDISSDFSAMVSTLWAAPYPKEYSNNKLRPISAICAPLEETGGTVIGSGATFIELRKRNLQYRLVRLRLERICFLSYETVDYCESGHGVVGLTVRHVTKNDTERTTSWPLTLRHLEGGVGRDEQESSELEREESPRARWPALCLEMTDLTFNHSTAVLPTGLQCCLHEISTALQTNMQPCSPSISDCSVSHAEVESSSSIIIKQDQAQQDVALSPIHQWSWIMLVGTQACVENRPHSFLAASRIMPPHDPCYTVGCTTPLLDRFKDRHSSWSIALFCSVVPGRFAFLSFSDYTRPKSAVDYALVCNPCHMSAVGASIMMKMVVCSHHQEHVSTVFTICKSLRGREISLWNINSRRSSI